MQTHIAVVGDTHFNLKVAACPPGVYKDDGDLCERTRSSRWIWECLVDFADKFRKLEGKKYLIVNADAGTFELRTSAGHERKTSGSYYTPDSLVQCLLDSALEPVIAEAAKGKDGAAAAEALLQLKICDPAVGSGHFLIAAAHRLRGADVERLPGDRLAGGRVEQRLGRPVDVPLLDRLVGDAAGVGEVAPAQVDAAVLGRDDPRVRLHPLLVDDQRPVEEDLDRRRVHRRDRAALERRRADHRLDLRGVGRRRDRLDRAAEAQPGLRAGAVQHTSPASDRHILQALSITRQLTG